MFCSELNVENDLWVLWTGRFSKEFQKNIGIIHAETEKNDDSWVENGWNFWFMLELFFRRIL